MTMVVQGKTWLLRLRDAAPLAWKHDQIFRYMLAVAVVAWTVILLHASQHSHYDASPPR